MVEALEKLRYTLEEYLTLEDTATERSEFYYGELFAMAGGTLNHNRIVGNLNFILRNQLLKNKRKCGVFTENVKLELLRNEYYVYPDVMLTCQPLDLQSKRIIQNPIVVVEVLSESTKGYDESTKKDYYLHLSSLNYYILVEQDTAHIKLYTRNQNSWLYQNFESLNDTITLADLDISFQMQEVYAEVDFESENQPEKP
jgi:Uma2 family endonuclease